MFRRDLYVTYAFISVLPVSLLHLSVTDLLKHVWIPNKWKLSTVSSVCKTLN